MVFTLFKVTARLAATHVKKHGIWSVKDRRKLILTGLFFQALEINVFGSGGRL